MLNKKPEMEKVKSNTIVIWGMLLSQRRRKGNKIIETKKQISPKSAIFLFMMCPVLWLSL
jgi:hypothetical protein